MNNSHKTAISRKKLSKPAQYLSDNGLLRGKCLDFGCGRGQDAARLDMAGYDPYYTPESYLLDLKYNTIMCNYVLNVIPDEQERNAVIEQIKSLLEDGGVAYISVRNDKANLKGWTTKGTWQGFIELDLPVVTKNSGFVMYKVTK